MLNADKINRTKQAIAETETILKKMFRFDPEFQNNELIAIYQAQLVMLQNRLADYEPVQIARPGEYEAVYAKENGIDYSTALALCNMD